MRITSNKNIITIWLNKKESKEMTVRNNEQIKRQKEVVKMKRYIMSIGAAVAAERFAS